MREERGSTLPMAAALVAIGIIVLVLALDVTLYAAAVREAAFAADAGAEAGAARIDRDARYAGVLVLDEASSIDAARSAARAARPRDGRAVAARVESGVLCVEVTQPFQGRLVTVAATITTRACAAPSEG